MQNAFEIEFLQIMFVQIKIGFSWAICMSSQIQLAEKPIEKMMQ